MMRTATLLLLALLAVPASYAQSDPAKWQVATITGAKELSSTPGPSSGMVRHEVTLRVGSTEYIVMYTQPAASKGVAPYRAGQDLLVQVQTDKIKYNDMLGRTHEVPIVRQRKVPAATAATTVESQR